MISRGLTVPDRLPPAYSLLIAAFVVLLDWAVSPRIEFPGLFIVPVIYASWYGGLRWGLPLSLLPLAHVVTIVLAPPADVFEASLTATFRIIALAAVAWWIASVAASQRALTKEVALLEGLLPICSHCKKIRDDAGDWQVIERYIEARSDATFTHGICDSCVHEHFGDLDSHWKRLG
jgi:hypothetical protein